MEKRFFVHSRKPISIFNKTKTNHLDYKFTICGLYNTETGNINIGMSVCNVSRDQWRRKEGNYEAEVRATEYPISRQIVQPNLPIKNICSELYGFMGAVETFPKYYIGKLGELKKDFNRGIVSMGVVSE